MDNTDECESLDNMNREDVISEIIYITLPALVSLEPDELRVRMSNLTDDSLRQFRDTIDASIYNIPTSKEIPEADEPKNWKDRYRKFTTMSYWLSLITAYISALFPLKLSHYLPETPRGYAKKILIQNLTQADGPKSVYESIWLCLGAFLCIFIIGVLSEYCFKEKFHNQRGILFASHGAAAALVFGAQKAPVAQPKNFLWGHVIGTSISIATFYTFKGASKEVWYISAALSVSISLFIMHITDTNNPPSVALALLFIVSSDFQKVSFWYVLTALLGIMLMMTVAVLFGNIFKFYRYPQHWRIM